MTNESNSFVSRGFILIPVVLTLTLLAAIAFMLSRQSTINAGAVVREHQPEVARYVAEAGLTHTLWQANASSCADYSDLTDVSFGQHRYTTSITPTTGSPVTIKSVSHHDDGSNYTISKINEKVYQTPEPSLVIQPDGDSGKDAYLHYPGTTDNYGSDTGAWISTKSNDQTVALYQFDVRSIPIDAKVLSATMSLFHRDGWGVDVPISAHRITKSWSEAEVSWANRSSSELWGSPAGDFDPQAIATTLVGPDSRIRYEWDLKSAVDKWISGQQVNYGVLLRTTAADIVGERFYTSDEPVDSRHPRLTIVYACECGQACGLPPEETNSITLSSSADTYIYETSKRSNFGSESEFFTSQDDRQRRKLSLLHFDHSPIPAGALVTSVTLRLYVTDLSNPANVSVYPAYGNWEEGSATWHHTYTTAFNDERELAVIIPTIGWTEWNLLTGIVNEWIDGVAPNYGLVLALEARTSGLEPRQIGFMSKESEVMTQTPQLVIEYELP